MDSSLDIGSVIGSSIGAAGSLLGGAKAASNAAQQVAFQREFAQNGIRWRVADAKAAGIHPLAALGAQVTGYTPISIGDNGISSALGQMGQGIDRAITAKQTAAERAAEQSYTTALRTLDLKTKAKQIEALDAEISQAKANTAIALRRAQTPPAMPPVETPALRHAVPSVRHGQGDLAKQALSSDGASVMRLGLPNHQNRGLVNSGKASPKYELMESPSGYKELIPSDDYKSRFEDMLVLEWIPYAASVKEALFGMPEHKWSWSRGWETKDERRFHDLAKRLETKAKLRKIINETDYSPWSAQ